MTISVQIKNLSKKEEEYSRSILVQDGAGAKYTLPPEAEVTVCVWSGTDIVVTEIDEPVDN